MEFVTQVVVRHTDDYHCSVDVFKIEDNYWLQCHILVYHFTPSVLKRLKKEFTDYQNLIQAPLYALAGSKNEIGTIEKWTKFVKQLGFHYLSDVTCQNGELRQLYRSLPTCPAPLPVQAPAISRAAPGPLPRPA